MAQTVRVGPIELILPIEETNRLAARIRARDEAHTKAIKTEFDPLFREARDRLRVYPSERPGQRYIRTFTLRKNWLWRSWSIIDGRTYGLYNKTPYAIFVQGAQQAWMHVKRWLRLDTVMNDTRKDAIAIMKRLNRELASGQ